MKNLRVKCIENFSIQEIFYLESNLVTYLSNVMLNSFPLQFLSFGINNDELSKITWDNKWKYKREKGGWTDSIQFGGITILIYNLFVTLIKNMYLKNSNVMFYNLI